MESALCHVLQDTLGGPRQFDYPRADLLVDGAYPLSEEGPFVSLEAPDDAVVVAHDEEDALAEDAEVLALLEDVAGKVGHFEPQPLPTAHLVQELVEGPAEVTGQQSSPAWTSKLICVRRSAANHMLNKAHFIS